MNERIPTVQQGEPITADAWNRLVHKLNEHNGAPVADSVGTIKGEFWLENTSSSVMPAFSLVYVTGFASTFSNESAAKTALASNRAVLSGALTGSSTDALAQLLEPIQPGSVGRATLPGGAGVFAVLAGSTSPSVGARVAISGRTFAVDDSGDFKIVAFDASSRFALLQFSPAGGATYTAGDGIIINNDQISTNLYLTWGVVNSAGSGWDTEYFGVGGYNSYPQLRFSNLFKSSSCNNVDGTTNRMVDLKSQALQVVTSVDFVNQTTTTAWINAIGGYIV